MIPLVLAVPVAVLDFSTSDGGLGEGGDTLQWEWGTPTVGPVGAGSCWATVLDGPYLNDSFDWLELPTGDVSALSRPSLELRHWYAVSAGDGGFLEVDEGGGFRPLAPVGGYPAVTGFSGASQGFVDTLWDLSGLSPGARFRLAFRADTAVADDGWYVSRVRVLDGDAVPPTVVPVTVPGDTQDLDGPYVLDLDVTDDVGVASVTAWWSADGGAEVAAPAVPIGGARYRASLPGQPPGTVVELRAEATDGENTTAWPEGGPTSFRVFLAAPTGLEATLPERPVVQQLPLSWDPPDSPHPVLGYEVLQDDDVIASPTGPSVTVAPDPALPTTFSVRALYDVSGGPIAGDRSATLDLELEVPTLLALDPSDVWQGETARLALSGASLYLQEGAVRVGLGEGIVVDQVQVDDAHAASLLVEVDADAPIGGRDLVIDAPLGTWTFPGVLRVGDDLDAPRIRSVTPAAVGQGDRVDLVLEANVPFGDDVTVTTEDGDLVLTSDPVVDGRTVTFGLAASSHARLGLHTLLVDDVQRILTADVLVEEVTVPLDAGCHCASTSPQGRPWLGALTVLAVSRRRRPRAGRAARAR